MKSRIVPCAFVSGLMVTLSSLPGLGMDGLDEASTVAVADPKDNGGESPKQEYVRIQRNDRRLASTLQTSVIRFANSSQFPGKVVDLLGAIHLGEESYYVELNRRFASYDVLLYESVIPEEALKQGLRPGGPGAGRKLNDEEAWSESKVGLATISALQLGMKDVLGLQFQLAGIDYTAANFVHADMTQEEMEDSMAQRGESFSEMLAREMAKAALQSGKTNPIAQQLDLLLSVLTSNRKYRIRRIAAMEMIKANDGDVFVRADGTSTIITERNVKALDVLRRELGNHENNRLGLFYGAGHFRDMEERMIDELGFERVGEEWITAWQLRAPRKTQTTDTE